MRKNKAINEKTVSSEFVPIFRKSFLYPRYWGTWLIVGAMVVMVILPPAIRDPFLGLLGRVTGRFSKRARRRAQINLDYCFPELNSSHREALIDQMFATSVQSIVMMAELAMFGAKRIEKRVEWRGREIIDRMQEEKSHVIFFVPHSWAVDIPAMLLASEGQKMVAIVRNQSHPLFDYLWNWARRRFGGRLHIRNQGIKHFVRTIREGYWGYYLPDQDHGAKYSEFADFFATYKATLPIMGRLMDLCEARIIPLAPVYDSKTHRLIVYVTPPLDDLSGAERQTVARRMNEELEKLIRPHPEQYMWLLKFLKTRKEEEVDPYSSKPREGRS